MSGYTWAWIGWLALFAVIEGMALYQSGRPRAPGDPAPRGTLSEHVWAWFGINTARSGVDRHPGAWARTRRVVLGGFLLWLSLHLMTGGAYF